MKKSDWLIKYKNVIFAAFNGEKVECEHLGHWYACNIDFLDEVMNKNLSYTDIKKYKIRIKK